MALTAAEEALVRELIAQNPELLSLAGNEATIISKLGATKKNLSQLAAALSLNDTDLAFVRQGTSDKSVVLSVLKAFVISGIPAASATVQGIVELATNAETQAGTDATRAVTPDGLSSRLATETLTGLVELATSAEAQAFTANKFIDGEKLADAFKGSNVSLSSNGYQKLPSGLIIQWGVTTLTGGISYTTVTLPIAYTTTNFGVYGNAVENVGGVTSEALEFGARRLTSFDAIVLSGTNPNNSKINWISVGY